MKAFLFLLLALLTSFSILLAQDEYNQVTEYRLKDRLKAEGYRLEETEKNLLCCTTTNYELPTTNCDNSAESLNCYLMMDPVESEKIVESFEGIIKEAEEAHTHALQDKQSSPLQVWVRV